jgi:hypothetical protein
MRKRLPYEAPEAELLFVRFEGNLLTSGDGYGREKAAGQDFDTDSAHIYTDDF